MDDNVLEIQALDNEARQSVRRFRCEIIRWRSEVHICSAMSDMPAMGLEQLSQLSVEHEKLFSDVT